MPTYYPSYRIGPFHAYFLVLKLLGQCSLLSSKFQVFLRTFNGNILLDFYRGGTAYFQSSFQSVEEPETVVPFNLIFQLYYFICMKFSLFCRFIQAMQSGLAIKVLSSFFGVMTPSVTPVTKLDLGLFLSLFFFSF